MRKLIALEFMTLDGVIQSGGGADEDPEGGFKHGGWVAPYADEESGAAIKELMGMPFDLLLGRKTFDIWAPYWPNHADIWPGVNSATKYVASNTLTSHPWGPSIFISGDVPSAVRQLKNRPGPDLRLYGSANLLQTLMPHDLVDEFWLTIIPVTLGSGKRLFEAGTVPAAFKLTKSHVTRRGVLFANFSRNGALTTGSLG